MKFWQVSFMVGEMETSFLAEHFSGLCDSVSCLEVDEGQTWQIQLLFSVPPDAAALQTQAETLLGHPVENFLVVELPETDWLREVQVSFPPFSIGRFYIYGSHVKEPPPTDSLPIMVDAATAFGSGEHPTTEGCLTALEQLARTRTFKNPLDMGCGSGILAIGITRLWQVPVAAVDNDPESVRVTLENARLNGVLPLISAETAEGYVAKIVAKRKPFDLIAANILASPLVAMAADLKASLAPGGIAVLSGLLTRQEDMVIAAHEEQGLHVQERLRIGEWSTLVLEAS
ncbi:MAG TPA: 50S ribosomal protein L11 methyltransferase [Rhodospirillaceae bacterium]|nr:50S ribosomal protein L11 methyltransferase [Rhodospirillaceae bacterium]